MRCFPIRRPVSSSACPSGAKPFLVSPRTSGLITTSPGPRFSPIRAYNDSVDSYLPADQYRNNLDVVTFQVTAAREFIPEKLSIGIGLQLLRGDLMFNNVNFRTTPMTEEPWVDEPYRNVPELSRNDGNGWGFGLNARDDVQT